MPSFMHVIGVRSRMTRPIVFAVKGNAARPPAIPQFCKIFRGFAIENDVPSDEPADPIFIVLDFVIVSRFHQSGSQLQHKGVPLIKIGSMC